MSEIPLYHTSGSRVVVRLLLASNRRTSCTSPNDACVQRTRSMIAIAVGMVGKMTPFQLGHRCMPKRGAFHILHQPASILLPPPSMFC